MENLRADKGTINKQRQLRGQFIGAFCCQAFSDAFESLPQLQFVGQCHLARRMIRFGKFRRDVDLWAAPIVWTLDAFTNPMAMCFEFGDGVV